MGGLRWNFLKHSQETVSFGGEQKRNPSNLSENKLRYVFCCLVSPVSGFWISEQKLNCIGATLTIVSLAAVTC